MTLVNYRQDNTTANPIPSVQESRRMMTIIILILGEDFIWGRAGLDTATMDGAGGGREAVTQNPLYKS